MILGSAPPDEGVSEILLNNSENVHPTRVYQNKCVNGIYKKLKNNLVAEPVGPVKNGFLFFTSP